MIGAEVVEGDGNAAGREIAKDNAGLVTVPLAVVFDDLDHDPPEVDDAAIGGGDEEVDEARLGPERRGVDIHEELVLDTVEVRGVQGAPEAGAIDIALHA